MELVIWQGADNCEDPTLENAYILNRSSHWFTIRKIHENWWNLNSTLTKPEEISPFYLSAFLAQLREDGYGVFIVKGNIPLEASRTLLGDGYGLWFKESQLLKKIPEEKSQEEKDLEAAIQMSLDAGKILGGVSVGVELSEEEKKREMREKRLAALEKR